ncbi:MAG TPA: hypothetical protein PKA06_16045, partial [Gemmatales bacterium]|nr:hypothetical protein [Gemmatales bacterium]
DSTTGRLYVLATGVNQVWPEFYPRMYVYQVGSGSPSFSMTPNTENHHDVQAKEVPTTQQTETRAKASSTDAKQAYHFQFGQSNSPTMEGYTKITSNSRFSSNNGSGWITGELWNIKQGLGNSFATQGLGTSQGEFGVQLTNGKYRVTVRLGHPTMALDQIGIRLQGSKVAEVKTHPGQSLARSFSVQVVDGILKLGLQDLGGRNRNIVIQALDIVPV